MAHNMISESTIKKKSQTLSIPYANITFAFLMEEFLMFLSESEYTKDFLIKNYRILHIKNYRKKPIERLEFFYVNGTKAQEDKKISVELLEEVMRTLFENEKNADIVWNYDVSQKDDFFRIDVKACFLQMEIPFQIMIEELKDDKIKPDEIDFRLNIRDDKMIMLNTYPTELVAEKYMFEILEKMELISDMSTYHRLYNILNKEVLDGRKVQQHLIEDCTRRKLSVDKSRSKMLASYRKYAYMKKKWQRYLKCEKITGPNWEEIVDKIILFFSQIWDMMCEDLIFIGDWMPEIGRFLD